MKKSEFDGWNGLTTAFFWLAAACIPICQAILWLKDGVWTPLTIAMAFEWLGVDVLEAMSNMRWMGAKSILLWAISLPLMFGIVVLALVQFFAMEWIGSKLESARERKRTQRISEI